MTDQERAGIVITARLLRACAPLPWLAIILIGVAAFAFTRATAIGVLIVSMAAGVTALVYGIRILFDARLFEDVLEERVTMQQLDATLGLKTGRPWSDRCRGARRLPTIAAVAILIQLMTLVLAAS